MRIEPRWLPAPEAASYVGMDTEAFRRAVRRGTFPAASYAIGKQSPRWDRVALDRAMGAGDVGSGIDEAVNGMVSQNRAEAKNRSEAVG